MSKLIGVLTSGGDTPGLNAAIRGIGKAASGKYDFDVIGYEDGFKGLVQNRFIRLEKEILSNILTVGGTILGTSRDKPHKMKIGNKEQDMRDVIVDTYHKHHLECLVCLGGGGTQKNALKLKELGLNVITLPKTIDNDIAFTDVTFGFDTAMSIATEAIDRLHSTAHSHHRIIILETMGHRVGWLALGAGLAGGADVILIPEIPYNIEFVAEAILKKIRLGKRFSIVAIAEGSYSIAERKKINKVNALRRPSTTKGENKELNKKIELIKSKKMTSLELAKKLEIMTGLESRVTILGHLQRGGTPSPADRLLATRLGTTCVQTIFKKQFGNMIAVDKDSFKLIPLEKVAGKKKFIPNDHPWIQSARLVGTCLGSRKK